MYPPVGAPVMPIGQRQPLSVISVATRGMTSVPTSATPLVLPVTQVLPQTASTNLLWLMMNNNSRLDTDSSAHPYVLNIDIVVKRISTVVFLVSVLSLIVSFSVGFNLIHPLFALLTAISCIGFYIMGGMVGKSRKVGK
jgi:hypothetical protein